MKTLSTKQEETLANFIQEVCGEEWDCICDDITITTEPLQNFVNISSSQYTCKDSGCVELEGVQRQKGQTRSTMYILDTGDFRAIWEN